MHQGFKKKVKQFIESSALIAHASSEGSNEPVPPQGGSRISGKGVHMYKGVGVRFADRI